MSVVMENPWDIRIKYSTKYAKSRLDKKFVPRLSKQIMSTVSTHLADDCEEIDVNELPNLPNGETITYKAAKTGKIVRGVTIIFQHYNHNNNTQLTFVGYHNNGSYVGPRATKQFNATGKLHLPKYGKVCWFISPNSISKLYKMKDHSIAPIEDMKREIESLRASLEKKNLEILKLIQIVTNIKEQIRSNKPSRANQSVQA